MEKVLFYIFTVNFNLLERDEIKREILEYNGGRDWISFRIFAVNMMQWKLEEFVNLILLCSSLLYSKIYAQRYSTMSIIKLLQFIMSEYGGIQVSSCLCSQQRHSMFHIYPKWSHIWPMRTWHLHKGCLIMTNDTICFLHI